MNDEDRWHIMADKNLDRAIETRLRDGLSPPHRTESDDVHDMAYSVASAAAVFLLVWYFL